MSRLQFALHAFPPGSTVTSAMVADTQALYRRLGELEPFTAEDAAERRAGRAAHLAKVAASSSSPERVSQARR